MTDKMYKLKDELCRELESMQGKNLSPTSVDYIHKLVVSIEKLMKTEVIEMELEEGESERRGYSRDGDGGRWHAEGSYRGGRSGNGASYDDGGGGSSRNENGGSYDAGGSSYGRRRDGMGRFSRDDGKKQMIDRLHRLMEDAQGEHERTVIRECIAQVENM